VVDTLTCCTLGAAAPAGRLPKGAADLPRLHERPRCRYAGTGSGMPSTGGIAASNCSR
jgi:hypothetical protein